MNAETCIIEYKKQDISTNALKKFYRSLDKHYVTVGIHKTEGAVQIGNNDFTMIKNACIQEFGNTQIVQKARRFKSPYTGKWFYIKKGTELRIPPRIFIRIFTEKKIQKELTNSIKTVIQQNAYKQPIEVYKTVGDYARLRMKERFLDNSIKPKNAPMTVAYKGSNDPLYISGKMANSIKSEVH